MDEFQTAPDQLTLNSDDSALFSGSERVETIRLQGQEAQLYLVIKPRDPANVWAYPPRAIQFYPALPDDVLLEFGTDDFRQHVTLGEMRQWLNQRAAGRA